MAIATAPRAPAPGKSGGLNGWKVLAMLLGMFGVVGGANAVMVGVALTTFRGEVSDHPYEDGLAFNSQIDAARAQEGRRWDVAVNIVPEAGGRAVSATFHGPDGAPLTGLNVVAVFAAPADVFRDVTAPLHEGAPGVYAGTAAASSGAWDLKITASRDGAVLYRSTNRIKAE
jgi:nitrogen fixation protein FixH